MNQQIKIKRPVRLVQNTTDVYLQGKSRNRYSHHQQLQQSLQAQQSSHTNALNKNNISITNGNHSSKKLNTSLNYNSNNRNDNQTIKSFHKKSIQNHPQIQTVNVSISHYPNYISNNPNATHNPSNSFNNNPYSQTISQPQRHYYKRNSQNVRRQLNKRYQQDQSILQHRNSMTKSPYLRKQSIPGRNSNNSNINKSNQKIRSGSLTKQHVASQLYKQPRSSLSNHYDTQLSYDHKGRSSVIGQDKQKQRNYILQQAKKFFKNGQYQKTIELLKKFTKISQNHVQGKYFLGMSYINLNQYNLGIQQLQQTIKLNPSYKKSIYLVLALSFKKLNKFQDAIKILSKGIQQFPQFHDCFMYRGKVNLKIQKYQQAIIDFDKAIKLNSIKGYSYLGKGTAQKELGLIKQAIQTFTSGLNTDTRLSCFQKRGLCYFQLNLLEKALNDFQKCTQIDRKYTQVNYYKGIINYKLKKPAQATLYLQQCLKHDTDSMHLTSAVQTMIKIKIQDKDFYQAYHILNRTENIDVNAQVIDQWRIFLQASLFLMKKKTKQGIQNYKNLLKKPLFKKKFSQIKSKQDKQRYAFIKPLVHLYKGFGQLNTNHIAQAKQQYQEYEDVCKQMNVIGNNLSKQYNCLIIEAYQNFPSYSREYLQKANQILKIKPQPYLYLVFDKIANWKSKDDKLLLTTDALHEMINLLSQGIDLLPQLSNNHISTFYYFRAVLFLYINQFNKAVSDIDKAIEKSQDNIPKYFYLRGLIFACFGNFTQAIQDLSVSISLDEKYGKPYLQRAKCLQIQGNSNQAFLDLQKYITLSPDDENIHKYAGFLLFQNCAYQDCLAAFTHGSQSNDLDIIITKAKCNFLLGQHQKAIQFLQKYQQIQQSSMYDIDIQMIKIGIKLGDKKLQKKKLLQIKAQLKDLFDDNLENTGKFFKNRDIYQLLSTVNLLLNQPQQALQNLTFSLQLFQKQKQKQLQKHFIQDMNQFEQQWSEIQLKFNMALSFLCMNSPQKAKILMNQFQNSAQKGKNWIQIINFINKMINGQQIKPQQISCFQQHHRLSKNWPPVKILNTGVSLNMAFSYPFVQPPQMIPQFDHSVFKQFDMKQSQSKPQAPWINRGDKGLIFTPNIQIFDQLQLSMTTEKKNENEGGQLESQQNKPISYVDKSMDSQRDVDEYLQGDDLKRKFKLDSDIEIKLKKLMDKK